MKDLGYGSTIAALGILLAACTSGGGGGDNGGGSSLPSLTVTATPIAEGDAGTAQLAFSVSLSKADSTAEITVDYATRDGTATIADGDYVASADKLMFAAGEIAKTIHVTVNGDTLVETDETFHLDFSNLSANASLGTSSVQATISNDDRPRLSIADVAQPEGDTPGSMTFTVSLDQPGLGDITFSYLTSDGSATVADNDYSSASGSETIATGATSATIVVPVTGDTNGEPDESFTLTLNNFGGEVEVVDDSATGTLLEDDRTRISVSDAAAIVEGNSGSSNLVFTVSLDQAAGADLQLTAQTADGTATLADGDYTSVNTPLTISSGSDSATVAVPVNGDTKVEGEETLSLNLSLAAPASWAYLADAQGSGNITDDDQAVLGIDDPSLLEQDSGEQPLTFTVSLTPAAEVDLTLDYATADASSGSRAHAGFDYTPTSGSLTIPAGQASASVQVMVKGDAAVEPDDVFLLQLSNLPALVQLGDDSGVGTILNDDDATLNDTGITVCATTDTTGLACNSSADGTHLFAGQDAEFGLDVASPDSSDGVAGLSFTKLDADGSELEASASSWSCVRDNVTGLIWEAKSNGGGLRDAAHTYTWFNSDATTNGSDGGNDGSGTADGGTCAGGSGCDTEKFVADVNATALCGYSDWRLPRVEEARSIILLGSGTGADIDTNFFPLATNNEMMWTNTPDSQDAVTMAWAVDFTGGYQIQKLKSEAFFLRLTRGSFLQSSAARLSSNGSQTCRASIEPSTPTARFSTDADGNVIDADTGLMWKRCSEGLTGNGCSAAVGGGSISYAALAHTWQQALNRVETVNATSGDPEINPGDYSDWRLPNVKELASIIERSCHNPALNRSVFPGDYKDRTINTESGRTDIRFWSSSPDVTNGSVAWTIQAYDGNDLRDNKAEAQVPNVLNVGTGYSYWVRLVRDPN